MKIPIAINSVLYNWLCMLDDVRFYLSITSLMAAVLHVNNVSHGIYVLILEYCRDTHGSRWYIHSMQLGTVWFYVLHMLV